MFSPTFDQSKPTALIRAAKSAPWLKSRWVTITLVQPWAERFRREFSLSLGRPWARRSWLTRQTTARCRSARDVWAIDVCAAAQALDRLWTAWPWLAWTWLRTACLRVSIRKVARVWAPATDAKD